MRYKFFMVAALLFCASILQAQEKILPRKVDLEHYQDSLSVYQDRYTQNKTYPSKYEMAYLIALSRYPGLEETEIDFAYKGLKTTMAARPKLNFIFKTAQNREYLIAINAHADKMPAVSASSIPFNGQIGLLAHELAHIADYSNKTAIGVIWDGIRYLFPGFKRKFEKATDKRTIAHGAGWQLYDFADYVLNQSDATRYYKKYKRTYYLQPHEILKTMQALGYDGVNNQLSTESHSGR